MLLNTPRIDLGTHLDLTDGGPLTCCHCGGQQTIEETEKDPLMYGFDLETIECDGCKESANGWAQEVGATLWEDSQR